MQPTIRVKFQIIGDQITPEEISNYLGMNPTETWLAGDSIQGTELRRKHNGWRLSTKRCQTYHLDEQINILTAEILLKSTVLAKLVEKYDLQLEINCDVDIVDEYPSINLSPESLSQLVELGVSLDIDLVA